MHSDPRNRNYGTRREGILRIKIFHEDFLTGSHFTILSVWPGEKTNNFLNSATFTGKANNFLMNR